MGQTCFFISKNKISLKNMKLLCLAFRIINEYDYYDWKNEKGRRTGNAGTQNKCDCSDL